MKKWTLLMMVLALVACSSLTPAEKEAQRIAKAQAIEKMLTDRHYTIDVQMMYPQRGRAKNVSGDYSLEVRGDTLLSYLPYFGRAYNIPYGGSKGLNFTEVMQKYSAAKGAQGETNVTIEVRNDEDTYHYTLIIFDNGSATIDVRPRERDFISFSGEISE